MAVFPIFGGLVSAMEDDRPALESMAYMVMQDSEQAFRTESDPVTGQPWVPLKASTLRRKRGPSILTEYRRGSGKGVALRDSMEQQIEVHKAIVGTSASVRYAGRHQFGDRVRTAGAATSLPTAATKLGRRTRRKGSIPQRRFLGASRARAQEMAAALVGHYRGLTSTTI